MPKDEAEAHSPETKEEEDDRLNEEDDEDEIKRQEEKDDEDIRSDDMRAARLAQGFARPNKR